MLERPCNISREISLERSKKTGKNFFIVCYNAIANFLSLYCTDKVVILNVYTIYQK